MNKEIHQEKNLKEIYSLVRIIDYKVYTYAYIIYGNNKNNFYNANLND